MKIDFFFDFETRSRHSDLKKHGSVRYVEDPTTEVTLLTYAFGRTGTVKAWNPSQPFPQELLALLSNPESYHFVAWNVMFDYLVWIKVLGRHIPYYHIKPIPIGCLTDAMALSCNFRTGAGLDTAAQILQIPHRKDKEGRRIMLKQCKPNAKGVYPKLTQQEWNHFVTYGILDTEILRAAYYRMPQLPPSERYAWEWTFRRNLRGIRVDQDLLRTFNDIIVRERPKLEQEFASIVGPDIKINSPVKCKEWFQQWYPEIKDMQADTLRDLLADTRPVPPYVRRALELKDLAGSTSIAKVNTGLSHMVNGRLYGLLVYSYAQTKRWAGRGIQIHNFPAPPSAKDNTGDSIAFDLNVQDLASVVRERMPTLKNPIGFVKNLLRRIWLADEGLEIYGGDFAKIEPTVLFWLVGLGRLSNKWYEEMAAEIFSMTLDEVIALGKDSEERALGKSTNLGSGYGMGPKKFREDTKKKVGLEISEELAKKSIFAYRNKYPEVTKLWRDLQRAFQVAIEGHHTQLCDGKIHVGPMEYPFKGVQIRLPSGSYLYYHHAAIREASYWDEEEEQWVKRRGISYISDEGGTPKVKMLYGGLLTEHVCSATSRDILVSSSFNLEQAGFDILASVHDELWGQGPSGRKKDFIAIMSRRPSWCADLDIQVEADSGVRYLK